CVWFGNYQTNTINQSKEPKELHQKNKHNINQSLEPKEPYFIAKRSWILISKIYRSLVEGDDFSYSVTDPK
ncbi:hypothetical protein EUTSA_v10027300mg, partial [Eutrema salsugineum]